MLEARKRKFCTRVGKTALVPVSLEIPSIRLDGRRGCDLQSEDFSVVFPAHARLLLTLKLSADVYRRLQPIEQI